VALRSLISALSILPLIAGAQGVSTTGIRGRVENDVRQPLDARVRVTHEATGFSIEVRAARGRYLVQGLEPGGPYTVTVRALGLAARHSTNIFLALGELQIPMTLTSLGPRSISFIVNGAQADDAARMLRADPGLPFERVDDCEMVSVVALGMWDIPGFLYDIARALYERDVTVLQMADSEGSVSVLVRKADATAALRALHEAFELGA